MALPFVFIFPKSTVTIIFAVQKATKKGA